MHKKRDTQTGRWVRDDAPLKTCSMCKVAKPRTLEHFRRHLNRLSGRCRVCTAALDKAKWQKTKADPVRLEKHRAMKRSDRYRATQRARVRDRRANEPGYVERIRSYKHTKKAKVRDRAYHQMRYQDPVVRKYYKDRHQRIKRKPEFRAAIRNYEARRKSEDPAFALRAHIGKVLNTMFINHLNGKGKNGRSWKSLFDFTEAELKAHLEERFVDGMTWNNRPRRQGGQGWEIDHIVPVTWWGIASIDDPAFKFCWSLSNLQPMWAEENRRKVAYRATVNGVTYTKEEWIAAGRPKPSPCE